MKGALTALRSVCLTVSLLVAVSGSATAQCPPPFVHSPHNFGTQAVGTTSASQSVGTCMGSCLAVSADIVGPNASEFVFQADVSCTGGGVACVAFRPAACGPRVAFLVVTTRTPDTINGVLFPAGCATDITPLVGTGVGAPVAGPPLIFPSTLAGTLGACVDLTIPADVTASIVGPGNFSLTVLSPTSIRVCFTPLAAACGAVTSTLILTSTLSGCSQATFPLSGFACSFECAIGLAGNPNLSAQARQCILESLQTAAFMAVPPITTAERATLCAALNCALCCAQADLATPGTGGAARRAAAQAVIDQIRCLQAAFCPAVP